MPLGEIAPGGIGSGLYGILILAIITVFVAGLMVGRTPEYLGKKIRPTEIKYAALYFLIIPAARADLRRRCRWRCQARRRRRSSTPARTGSPRSIYAFTSVANNNGSAFAGLSAQHDLVQHGTGGIAMLLGRFAADDLRPRPGRLAGPSSSRSRRAPGTLRDRERRCSSACSSASILIIIGLTYFPALALGPLAEGLH